MVGADSHLQGLFVSDALQGQLQRHSGGVDGVECDRAPLAIAAPVSRGVRAYPRDGCGDLFEKTVSSWPRLGLCLECGAGVALASPLCAVRCHVAYI